MAMVPATSLRFPPRLVVGLQGPPFSGKTHFLFSMPRRLNLVNFDNGLEGMMTAEKFDLSQVNVGNYFAESLALGTKGAKEAAQATIQRCIADIRAIYAQTTRRQSIGIDTGSELWRTFRFADLGALKQVPPLRYDKVNMLFTNLINDVYRTPHNFAIIHRTKGKYREEVKNGVKVSTRIEGEEEIQGFKDMEYLVQVFIECYRLPKVDAATGKKRKGAQRFGFRITKCRHREILEGRTYEGALASFPYLALDVLPKSKPEDWGL